MAAQVASLCGCPLLGLEILQKPPLVNKKSREREGKVQRNELGLVLVLVLVKKVGRDTLEGLYLSEQ